MELEEMQEAWSQMSEQLEQQELLTNKIIMEMTQQRYRNKFSKLSKIETFGAIICFLAGLVILANLKSLDTWYLLSLGIFSIAYLFALPISVLLSIKQIRTLDFANNTYKKTLQDFASRKKRLLSIQKFGISFNFIFLLIFLPVVGKIMNGKDIFHSDSKTWLWFIPVLIVVMILVSAWGYKWYKRIANSAETTLMELEE